MNLIEQSIVMRRLLQLLKKAAMPTELGFGKGILEPHYFDLEELMMPF